MAAPAKAAATVNASRPTSIFLSATSRSSGGRSSGGRSGGGRSGGGRSGPKRQKAEIGLAQGPTIRHRRAEP
ncbi:MAG: hypothetical protein EOQ92_12970 [Mesorhizobium sp.]|nr:MAG: hypothetical protein EOQ92_12970 [Mesorhizobium sp.]RWK52133.1 MAG: hypothetical protein EOR47_05095 [Mesorhizobium sp.]RWK96734.1 MAG: hypothetical protein EOR53_07830 [Mesorhizobium sp.]RWL02178.1 MAG: hypothetical protein EOR45_16550 [Mesorhizobium sp.]TIP56407.1 MAG: hypothetical protein E5X56_24695 [Mesorhizobium sp.]